MSRPTAPITERLERRVLLSATVVNSAVDKTHPANSAVVSLRDAINFANKSAIPTTITFDPVVFATARVITLNGNALEISGKHLCWFSLNWRASVRALATLTIGRLHFRKA